MIAEIEEGAVACGGGLAETIGNFSYGSGEGEGEALGEVDLEDVAGADVGDRAVDRREIFISGEGRS